MNAHLSRKDLKTDEVREALDRLVVAMSHHWRKIVLAATAVIIAILAAWAAVSLSSAREDRAQRDLVAALRIYDAQLDTIAPQPDGDPPTFSTASERSRLASERFQALVDSYSSSDAARVARGYLAEMLASDGNLAAAQEIWRDLESAGGSDALAATIDLNLISAARSEGRLEELASDLRSRLERSDQALPEDSLMYELGTTLEALDRDAEAETIFQRLVDEHPSSPFAFEARQKLPPPSP